MRIDPGDRAANLSRALVRITEAAHAGADIVLLPEALPLGWMAADTREAADAIPDGPTCVAFREAARHAGVHICTGVVERAGDTVYNAAVLIAPDGTVLLHHRKLNELAIAQDLYARGDRLGVAETPWGRVGLMVCADAFADGEVVSRTLALMGAGIILSPAPGPCRPATTRHGNRTATCGARATARSLVISGSGWQGRAASAPSRLVRGQDTPASAARSSSAPRGSRCSRGRTARARMSCCTRM